MGFKPEDTQGHMFNKKHYGLNVPDDPHFDAMNSSGLKNKRESLKDSGIGKLKNLFLDGFNSVDKSKISPAVQDQFNDAGKVKKIYPSCTATGYLKKKHKYGKKRD